METPEGARPDDGEAHSPAREVETMRRTIPLLAAVMLLVASLAGGAEGVGGSSRTPAALDRYERAITLHLRFGVTSEWMVAVGELRTIDARRHPCETGQVVVLQRLVPGEWWQDRSTGETGAWVRHRRDYVLGGGPRGTHPAGSRWRVLALESILPDGDVCVRAVSPVKVHDR